MGAKILNKTENSDCMSLFFMLWHNLKELELLKAQKRIINDENSSRKRNNAKNKASHKRNNHKKN